jgi:hypothetical protein
LAGLCGFGYYFPVVGLLVAILIGNWRDLFGYSIDSQELFLMWVAACPALYLAGLAVRWVYRGFKAVELNNRA